MKIEVENQPNCLSLVKVEVPSERVNELWDEISGEFRKIAKLPGFRPGKAPKNVVERKYGKEIQEELTKQLVSEGTREAIKKHELNVLSVSKVDDIEFSEDKTMTYSATVITAPEFELPEYKGIAVKIPSSEVSDAEINDSLGNLRERSAEFEDVDGRPADMEDYVVIDYKGTTEGMPIAEVAPQSGRTLSENNDFWLRIAEDAFLPGFSAELIGMNTGDSKEFDLDMPEDFPAEELKGRKLHFEVTLKGIKKQILPELDDGFASSIVPDKSLAELREIISGELKQQKEGRRDQEIRKQVMDNLLSKLEFELPDSFVRDETRRVLDDIVRENQMRGVDDKELEEHKSQLIEGAERGARNRLRTTFILLEIAKKEKIEVTNEDMSSRIAMLSQRYKMTPDKLLKELQKRDAIDNVREEVMTSKTLDFIAANASVEETNDEEAPTN